MKKPILQKAMFICLISVGCSMLNLTSAQTDSTKTIPIDTTVAIQTDTSAVAATEPALEKEKKAKRKDEFIVYAGANISNLTVESESYESGAALGYNLGFAYRRGHFFYWQLGAEFNNASYEFQSISNPSDSASFALRSIKVPITGGINLLSATNRVLGLRVFASLVPSYAIGVGDNGLNIDSESINSLMFSGQLGIGINVAFFIVDVGYNYGFNDVISDVTSKPGQAFVNLGFRF